MDNNSPHERSGLEIQNLDASVLTTSIDRFPPQRQRQYGALIAIEGMLQDRRRRRAIPQLLLPVNPARRDGSITDLDGFVPASCNEIYVRVCVRGRVIRSSVRGR